MDISNCLKCGRISYLFKMNRTMRLHAVTEIVDKCLCGRVLSDLE